MQQGYIFDLDGTVYLDETLIAGAREAIETLEERGDKVVFLTNKSIETVESYVEKLNRLGISAERSNVVNSNLLVARYLKSNLKTDEKIMVIGERPLYEEIEWYEIEVSENPSEVSYVVLGWDREFSYHKLNLAFQAWVNGAKIVATNPDRTCPVENDGQVPDCGAMIGALEGATGEKIDLILGKPSSLAADYIVNDILDLPAEQCFMVGDRLETDIKMGLGFGINSVLVLTGISDETAVKASPYKPDYIIDSIKDVVDLEVQVP